MIVPFRELLRERAESQAALAAFTCYDTTTAFGVILAAERRNVPVALLLSESAYRAPEGRLLLASLLAVAREAQVPSCVQLDHTSDLELVASAFAAGAGSVMADGSSLPPARNVELVTRAQELASRHDADVEAELGHVAGDEDVASSVAADLVTDPDEAQRFAALVAPACLAVSVGNVHGLYDGPPALDWTRLERIAARTGVPLALHGASGLGDADIVRAVRLGVRKVNVNTDVRRRIYRELEGQIDATATGFRLLDLDRALVDAVAEEVDARLAVLSGRSAQVLGGAR